MSLSALSTEEQWLAMRRIRNILFKIFEDHPRDFNIRLWDGHLIEWCREPKFTLIFRDKKTFKNMLLNNNALTAGSAFIENKIDIEGDIFEAIRLGNYLSELKLSGRDRLKLFTWLLML